MLLTERSHAWIVILLVMQADLVAYVFPVSHHVLSARSSQFLLHSITNVFGSFSLHHPEYHHWAIRSGEIWYLAPKYSIGPFFPREKPELCIWRHISKQCALDPWWGGQEKLPLAQTLFNSAPLSFFCPLSPDQSWESLGTSETVLCS